MLGQFFNHSVSIRTMQDSHNIENIFFFCLGLTGIYLLIDAEFTNIIANLLRITFVVYHAKNRERI
jgi:hypothetical protein